MLASTEGTGRLLGKRNSRKGCLYTFIKGKKVYGMNNIKGSKINGILLYREIIGRRKAGLFLLVL